MPAEIHASRVCGQCGGQLQPGAEVCPWCHAPAAHDRAQRLRVRKRRSVLKTYFEHVRRHWILFFLAILAAIAAAWFLLDFVQRPRQAPAPGSIIGASSAEALPLSFGC
jgi:hypothetical protein